MSFHETDDTRSLDLFNASNVKPVTPWAKSERNPYRFPCTNRAYRWESEGRKHHHVDERSRQECNARAAEIAKLPPMYSDEHLTEMEASPLPGDYRVAPILRGLDTPERRKRAVAEAHTLVNISGGIYSHAVSRAVREIKSAIANGTEDKMLYGEKFAHDARMAEKALRERTGNPNAIYYPAFPGRG